MRRALSVTAGIGLAATAVLALAAPGTQARWQVSVTTEAISVASGVIGISIDGREATHTIGEVDFRAAVADGERTVQIIVNGVNDGDDTLVSSLGPVAATDNSLLRVLTADLTVGTDSCDAGTGTEIYTGTAAGLAGFIDDGRVIVPTDAASGTLVYCITLGYPDGTGLSTSTATASGSGAGATDSAGATTRAEATDTESWYGTARPGDELYNAEIVLPFTATTTQGATP